MKQIQAVFIEAAHGRTNKFPWLAKDPGVVRKMEFTDAIRGKYTEVITEHDLSKEIALMVVDILKAKPELARAIVTGVGTGDGASITKKVKYVRDVIINNKLDPSKTIGVAIHINSGGGKGCEAFYDDKNPEGKVVAKSITDSVNLYTKFGFHGDPVKIDTSNRLGNLYIGDMVVNGKGSNYVLLEICYIDNDKEINYLLQNKPRIAESIAAGIMNYVRA